MQVHQSANHSQKSSEDRPKRTSNEESRQWSLSSAGIQDDGTNEPYDKANGSEYDRADPGSVLKNRKVG